MKIYVKYIDYIMARNHKLSPQILHLRFESNVIYIGTKTNRFTTLKEVQFESNVIYIGTKTNRFTTLKEIQFESNVIYIGTKTKTHKQQ